MTCAVIIPARFGSTRFPGKVLMRGPSGKPLIQYAWEAATRAEGVDETLVATDDERIAEAVRAFGGEARMTQSAHPSGSDRCAEVARGLRHDLVVNLQADEAGILPEMISQTVRLLREDPECEMSTLACRIRDESELTDPGVVKVVLDRRSRALYFSQGGHPAREGIRLAAAREPGPAPAASRHLRLPPRGASGLRRAAAAPARGGGEAGTVARAGKRI